ncbi:MAG: hypothetical protein MHM6MM_002119 [Cercozoa sp. M6MM]
MKRQSKTRENCRSGVDVFSHLVRKVFAKKCKVCIVALRFDGDMWAHMGVKQDRVKVVDTLSHPRGETLAFRAYPNVTVCSPDTLFDTLNDIEFDVLLVDALERLVSRQQAHHLEDFSSVCALANTARDLRRLDSFDFVLNVADEGEALGLHCVQRRTNGRVVRQQESLQFEPLRVFVHKQVRQETDQTLPNASFAMSLTDAERAAKNAVTLAFQRRGGALGEQEDSEDEFEALGFDDAAGDVSDNDDALVADADLDI